MQERIDLIGLYDANLDAVEQFANLELRPGLREIFEKSKETVRFVNLGFVNPDDNVYIHTLRMVYHLDSLPIAEPLKQRAKMAALLHDIPETEMLQRAKKEGETVADVTATAKALDEKLAAATEESEDEVARDVLTEGEEYQLYQEVSLAAKFLKGGDVSGLTATGLIVRVVDMIDSDLKFHLLARENGPAVDLSPKGQALSFEQHAQCSERLSLLEDSEVAEAARLCSELLDRCMKDIKRIWEGQDYIPPVIRANLNINQK